MDSTRASLLVRIRDPDDSVSWSEFFRIYSPLIYQFARARGLTHDDAEEIRSSCYETIVKKIQDFEYSPEKGSFKGWLRTLVLNRVIDLKRKRPAPQLETGELGNLPDDQPTPESEFEQQWRISHLNFCLERAKAEVSQTTRRAFDLLTEGHSVESVAEQLDLSSNQVYKAKSNILQRVRQHMRWLLGAED